MGVSSNIVRAGILVLALAMVFQAGCKKTSLSIEASNTLPVAANVIPSGASGSIPISFDLSDYDNDVCYMLHATSYVLRATCYVLRATT